MCQIDSISEIFFPLVVILLFCCRKPMVLDWLWSDASTHVGDPNRVIVDPPIPPISDPSNLDYSTSRIILMKQPDAPFSGNYWDYPTRSPADKPEVIYSDPITHQPLFSSKFQEIDSTGKCVGKLFFSKPIGPIIVEKDGSVVSIPSASSPVVSHVDDTEGYKCATSNGMIPAGFRIGGGGPGSAEMSSKISGGLFKSKLYQQLGPHFLGRKMTDGSICVEPSAVDARSRVVHVISAPDVPIEEQDSLIKINNSYFV
jgi:hypothetical protein